jgi:hypothetical protein
VKNQNETDVDCGGGSCPACGVGKGCATDSDCATGDCDAGGTNTCQPVATCNDGKKNQDESDVDCGGRRVPEVLGRRDLHGGGRLPERTCDNGGTNTCVSAVTPTCSDNHQEPGETDVDCGGPSGCPKCDVGEGCVKGTDCTTGVLRFHKHDTCIAPTRNTTPTEDTRRATSALPVQRSRARASRPSTLADRDVAANCYVRMFCADELHDLGENEQLLGELERARRHAHLVLGEDEHLSPTSITSASISTREEARDLGPETTGRSTRQRLKDGRERPNGLKWEYTRSMFVDPNHVPWNQVWVDDINMARLEHEPTLPRHRRPWNGKLTSDATPTFEWQSFDRTSTPLFTRCSTTRVRASVTRVDGEIQDTTFTPAATPGQHASILARAGPRTTSNYAGARTPAPWVVEHQHDARDAPCGGIEEGAFDMNTKTNLVVRRDRGASERSLSQTLSAAIVHGDVPQVAFNNDAQRGRPAPPHAHENCSASSSDFTAWGL